MMKPPERIFVCGPGQAPRIVNLGPPVPLLWSALPLSVFGGLLLVVLLLDDLDAHGRFMYLAATVGLAALGMELVFIIHRHDRLNPDEPWAPWPSRIRPALRSLNDRKTITDAVLRRTLDVLVPFFLVGTMYAAMQLWIDTGFQKQESERTVLWLEQSAIMLRSLNPCTRFLLKIPKWVDLVVTATLVLLAISIPMLARLPAWWKSTGKWLGRAYITLTLIASVTFFGNQQAKTIDATSARWNREIKEIRKAYGEATEQVERDLSDAVAREIASQSQPVQDWKTGIEDLDAIDGLYTSSVQENVPIDTRLRAASAKLRPKPPVPGTANAPLQEPTESAFDMPRADEQSWSARGAQDFEADVVKAERARGELRPEFRPIVEKLSDSIYSVFAENALNPVLKTAGLDNEIVSLILDPLLNTPMKEWLKIRMKSLADAVCAHRLSIKAAEGQINDELQAHIPDLQRTWEAAGGPVFKATKDFRTKAHSLRTQAETGYNVSLRERTETARREFIDHFRKIYETPGASDPGERILAGLNDRISRISDGRERYRQIDAWSEELLTAPSTLGELARFEQRELGTRNTEALERALIPIALREESAGRWGQLRAEAREIFLRSRYRPDISIDAVAHIDAWHKAKLRYVAEVVESAKGVQDLGPAWERAFVRHFSVDPPLAVVWAYLVIATDDSIGLLKPGGATPADGLQAYLDSTGAATVADLRPVITSEGAIAMNDSLCGKDQKNSIDR